MKAKSVLLTPTRQKTAPPLKKRGRRLTVRMPASERRAQVLTKAYEFFAEYGLWSWNHRGVQGAVVRATGVPQQTHRTAPERVLSRILWHDSHAPLAETVSVCLACRSGNGTHLYCIHHQDPAWNHGQGNRARSQLEITQRSRAAARNWLAAW